MIEDCPICGKSVEYFEFQCDETFTAPTELRFKGLNVWGVYSAEKEIICQNDDYVHFKFAADNHERLVKMLKFLNTSQLAPNLGEKTDSSLPE